MRAPEGMSRVPCPGLLHHATSAASVSAIVESGVDGAQMQKSNKVINQRNVHDLTQMV